MISDRRPGRYRALQCCRHRGAGQRGDRGNRRSDADNRRSSWSNGDGAKECAAHTELLQAPAVAAVAITLGITPSPPDGRRLQRRQARHGLVEKPIGLSLEQCAAADANGVKLHRTTTWYQPRLPGSLQVGSNGN